ncbi:hypothetical protein LIER_11844 [Lithospermum erythrorhizon]|uniref:Cysteine-rich transmembrane domain-containing protein n=1 Tax=Lithospermum erythrorhizon TaxID=34254 RepID=A0AAV3PQZ7_LITER
MSNFNQQQVSSYPAPPASYPAGGNGGGQFVSAPPPIGYPTRDESGGENYKHSSGETTSRGDGFWKGCCAALCCCCVLDACF